MSYRCGVCDQGAPHGQPLLKHTVYREVAYGPSGDQRLRREIEREVPLCQDCQDEISAGTSFEELVRETRGLPPPLPPLKPVAVGRPLTSRPRISDKPE